MKNVSFNYFGKIWFWYLLLKFTKYQKKEKDQFLNEKEPFLHEKRPYRGGRGWWEYYTTPRHLYFGTLEVSFMFSSCFQELGFAFNLEFLSDFFININIQWKFFNPHDEQIKNLSLIFAVFSIWYFDWTWIG